MILSGVRALHHILNEYVAHYHFERNHQGIGNNLVFPQRDMENDTGKSIECRERLGGLRLKTLVVVQFSCISFWACI